MKIAGIQVTCSNDIEKNLKETVKYLNIAVEKNSKIICLQELSIYPWFPLQVDEDNFKLANSENDEIFDDIKKISKESECVIILPFFERGEIDGNFYNSAMVIQDGEIIGKYRKIHLPLIPGWEEKYYFKVGDLGFPVIKTKFGKIGIMLGWDIFFPEVSRILTIKGAEIIFAPTASAFSSQPRWLKIIGANALMNTVFIARINRVGKEEDVDFYGGSFCFAPDGVLLSESAGETEGIIFWEINYDDLYEVRRLFPFLKDRIDKEYLEIAGLKYSDIGKSTPILL
jgi:N-carbamoylputrescine amidase